MQYYNSKGEIVELEGTKSGKYGFNSEIMRVDENVFYKRYFWETVEENRILVEVFEFIKQVRNKHLIKLIERYYQVSKDKNIVVSDLLENPGNYIIDAYTYEWVPSENIDILDMPIDYLIDNLKELLDLADYLSEYGLFIMDAKVENSVLNSEGIVLIDPDIYTFARETSFKEFLKIQDNDRIKSWNRHRIVDLIKAICFKSLQLKNIKKEGLVVELFEKPSWDGTYDASIVEKKLRGYKSPLEYLVSTHR